MIVLCFLLKFYVNYQPRWEGNPKGLSGPLKGGVIIDYLQARFNFTYEMVRVTENRMEPLGKERGLFSYLFDNQSDLIVSAIVLTHRRNKIIDQTTPWECPKLGLLIPIQDDTANTNAVWVGLVLSAFCVIAVLSLMHRYLEYRSLRLSNQPIDVQRRHVYKSRAGSEYLYVFGNLLSQGGPCSSNLLPFRLVAGVWTLAAFIFVQAYTSTLFTYVVAPVNPPLINSIYDIAESPDINLLNNNWTGFYEKIRDRIKSYPQSRCTLVSECIDLVKPGLRNVFIDAEAYQKDAIKENFEKTGQCNLQMARDSYMTVYAVMALQKNSPYTNSINKGIMELGQSGLLDYWEILFRPMPRQCQGKIQRGYKSPENNQHPPLSLKNLTGAFIILSIGFSLSILAFLVEQIISMSKRHRRQLRPISNDNEKEHVEIANKESSNNIEQETLVFIN
uniref:Ionotropic glutamate receptor C-terminal domain-containing protein n=1 Tax=Daphnia galeata TaxID=27404 RepID=A0A8J2W246_9CRUS|nr:unnamed protein product [Daphnia galeata]